MKLAILGGLNLDPVTGVRLLRPGHLDFAEIVGPRVRPFPSLRQAALLTACFMLVNIAATLVLGIWLGGIAAAVVVVGRICS